MKDAPSLEEFLVRPQIKQGESLAGYCWRIYSGNGHDVCNNIRMALKAVLFNKEAQNLLLAFLGAEVLAEVKHQQEKTLERWNVHAGPQWYSLAKTPRLCPACIEEEGFHAFLWDLPFVHACPIHGLELLNRCPGCHGLFAWNDLRPGWVCRCGLRISRALGRPSHKTDVQFARIVCGAEDACISERTRDSGIQNLLGAPAYETHHVYEMLWWLHRMRRSLTVRQFGRRHMATKLATGKKAIPTAIDIKHLTLKPHNADIKVLRALRWQVRRSRGMLVDFEESGFIYRLHDVLNALARSDNPAAYALLEQVGMTLSECSSHVEGADQLIVHPRLTGNCRQQVLQTFEHWWSGFATGIPTLRQEDQRHPEGFSGKPDRSEGDTPPDWLVIMNVFLAVANGQLEALALTAVQRRWHIPAHLCQPSNAVSEVVNYLRRLHPHEQSFLRLMLGDAATPYTKT